jgi:NitT/TauT family transport system substrate-binding protein
MRRRKLIASLISPFLLASVPKGAWAQPVAEKIRVTSAPTEGQTNLFYAIRTGMFHRAGLDVEMVSAFSGAASTAAVVSGTYEMGRTSVLALFSAHLREIPVTIVAPDTVYNQRNPVVLLQVSADSPYKTGADLNGKTIGVASLNDLYTLATRAWVDKNGGDWRSLKFVENPLASMEAVLVQHRVDAAVLQTPVLDASIAAGTTRTIGDPLRAVAPIFMYGAYVARIDWATQHADAVRRFNRILSEATTYVNGHPVETAPLVAEMTKMDVANVSKLRRALIATRLEAGLVQPVIDAAVKYDAIARPFSARELLWNEGAR